MDRRPEPEPRAAPGRAPAQRSNQHPWRQFNDDTTRTGTKPKSVQRAEAEDLAVAAAQAEPVAGVVRVAAAETNKVVM